MDHTSLLLAEDFSGDVLNATRWERCPEESRQGGAAIWADEMSFLDGEGHLVLRACWDADKECVKSGAIRTKGLFEAGLGYYEASVKFPVAKGIWGAFWLMCGDVMRVSGTAADGVEIDIVESINNEKGAYNFALHYDGYGEDLKSVKSGLQYDAPIYDGNFHLFGLDRGEDHYSFYIDGKEMWRVVRSRLKPATFGSCS